MGVLYSIPGVRHPAVLVGERPAPDWDGRPGSILFSVWFQRFAARVLQMDRARYLRTFARANIVERPGQAFRLERMRERARTILEEAAGRPVLVLGARAAEAFGLGLWQVDLTVGALPHPSGRCRVWNEPGALARARGLVEFLMNRSLSRLDARRAAV